MSPTGQFNSSSDLFLYLDGCAVFKDGLLANTAHDGFTRSFFAFAEIGIAFGVGVPVESLNRIVGQLVKVDMGATVMQDVEFAAALDRIEELQIVLLAKLTILVGSEHPFTGPRSEEHTSELQSRGH